MNTPSAKPLDLCDGCSAISWALPEPLEYHRRIRTIFATTEELLSSKCRVCFILGKAMPTSRDTNPAHVVIDRWGWIRFELELTNGQKQLSHGGAKLFTVKHPSKSQPREHDFLARWLEECKSTHTKCSPTVNVPMYGLRVIDCVLRKVVPVPIFCSYTALSYVWGNVYSHKYSGSDFSGTCLPQTIEDSMKVTQDLGYRYLWVDRYCIDQEDEQEKDRQIRQMGAIYSSAQFVIIAAAGADPSYGLPGVSRERQSVDTNVSVGSTHLRLRGFGVHDSIANSVWVTRAWTFQEGFLAKRRVVFTDAGAAYICSTGAHYEVEVLDSCETLYPEDFTWIPQGEVGIKGAQSTIKAYTQRRLGFDSDALNAITGALAALSMNKIPVYHIWAVPFGFTDIYLPTKSPDIPWYTRDLEFCLFWHHSSSCRRRAGFPSWSPLGWSGAVRWSYEGHLIVPGSIVVEIWADHAYHELRSFMLKGGDLQNLSSTEESQILRITARALPFRKLFIEANGLDPNSSRPPQGWYVRIEVDNNTHLLSRVLWDDPESELASTLESGVCIAISEHSVTALALFLVERAGNYERSGYLDKLSYCWIEGDVGFVGDGRRYEMADCGDVLGMIWDLSQKAEERTFLLY